MNRANNKMLHINLQKLYKIKTYNNNILYRIKVRADRKSFCLTNVGPLLWNNLNINLNTIIIHINLIKTITNI